MDKVLLTFSPFSTISIYHTRNRNWAGHLKGQKTFKKLYGSFFIDGLQLSQGCKATTRRQFSFYHWVPKSSWYSFDQPRKDKRLSWPCTHPIRQNSTLYSYLCLILKLSKIIIFILGFRGYLIFPVFLDWFLQSKIITKSHWG